MFRPKINVKTDPERRWLQSDRVFFGFGACHILAGVFLQEYPRSGFWAEWIAPADRFSGTHIYVTDGVLAFDFHGYSRRAWLLEKYWSGHQALVPGWSATIERIDFSLLDRTELNKRKHLGPDQYFGDPIARAQCFISSIRPPSSLRNLGRKGGGS